MNSITLLSFLILGLGVCMSLSAVAAQGEGQKPVVVLDTSAGPITVQLDPEKAPITVENFLKYVDEGFYDNLIFHRVMSGFMVQGGGMTDQMEEKSTGKHAPIKNESKGGFDLRLISSLNDASGIPTEGKNLIIVAAVNHVLHFRIFDGDGKVVEDTDERLTEKARQIEDLRKQLESLWPPHELTASEKGRVITAVTSIVGHTPKGGLSNLRGTIAMARTNNPDSATCQFFINHVDNQNLDTYGGGYTVFGKVIDGMNVVDEIAKVPTTTRAGHQNVPVKPIYIKSAKRKTS